MFLDSMAPEGVTVERPVIPTLLEVSKDESVLKDPQSHAVKVCTAYVWPREVWPIHVFYRWYSSTLTQSKVRQT